MRTAATVNITDSTVSDYNEIHGKLKARDKSFNLCSHNLKLDVRVKEKAEKQWKKYDRSTNNSTLSLHIAAFENSVEAVAPNSIKKNKKEVFSVPAFVTQNSFEFPRQQNDKVIEPEVSQFGATQQLFNPNEALTNGQQNASVFQQHRAADRVQQPLYSVAERRQVEILFSFSTF